MKNLGLYIGFGVTIPLLIVGVMLPYKMNDLLGWKALDQQIKTNETLTKSFDCDKVQYYYEDAKNLIFTPHPEIVKDFHDLGLKKGCAFAESTK